MSADDRKRVIPRERLALTEQLYLQGLSTTRIQQRLSKKFGVTFRTARRYIERVRAKLAALPKPPPEAAFQRAESMLLDAFTEARKATKVVKWVTADGASESRIFHAPDTGAMVAAAQRVAELYGVASPQKIEITGANGGPVETHALTDDELDRRLAELERRRGQ